MSAYERFEGFDAEESQQVLSQLVPDNLLLWHVSQHEPTTEDVPYHAGTFGVAPSAADDLQRWQHWAAELACVLPEEHEFAATHDIANVVPTPDAITLAVDEPGAASWLRHAAARPGDARS